MNRDMTLETFKFIYWMEWSHRMLGRTVGVVFGLPLLYFMARGRVKGPLVKPLVALFLMGGSQVCGCFPQSAALIRCCGSQGLIGWWMVKSGLEEPEHAHSEPKVR
jgi:cytochrome c oxidase assembly protein subunit 15